MRAFATVASAAAVFAAGVPGVARAERVLGRSSFPTSVTAFHGHVVWSSYHSRTRTYSLREWFRDRTRTLPVARRDVAFDVDLGPGPDGKPTAVYSRCRRDGGGNLLGSDGQFGPYTDARGCDLYRFSLVGDRRERRLHVRGERATSEYLPTIWRNRIAFARVFERRRGRAGVYQNLYTSDVGGRQRPRRLHGGKRSSHPVEEGGPGPIALDLRGKRLAFAWEALLDGCHGRDEMDYLGFLLSDLWVVDVASRAAHRIDHACGDDNPTLWMTTPTLGPRRVFYYRQQDGTGPGWGSHLLAFDFGTKGLSDRRMPYRTVAVARDSAVTYYVRRTGEYGAVIARA